MERETGIEPATNSLEGCDSTTELLPQFPALTMVAREGFEPSKPLGRQIYSLLRLTASLPRQVFRPVPLRTVRGGRRRPAGTVASPIRARRVVPVTARVIQGCCRGCAFLTTKKPGELAKGFEPPTG